VQKVVQKRCKNAGPEIAVFTEARVGNEWLECRVVGTRRDERENTELNRSLVPALFPAVPSWIWFKQFVFIALSVVAGENAEP
jgi:hypothetical protein